MSGFTANRPGEMFETGRDAFLQIARDVMENGDESAPRGMATRELLAYGFAIAQPWDVIPNGIGRAGYHSAIGAAECLQDIVGVATPALMSRISRNFPKPSSKWDAGVQTYGPRLQQGEQLRLVVEKLRSDPDSRQALALIWRHDDPMAGQAHNICTVALQFMVRDGTLCAFGIMRSNDVWHGLPYDLQQFCGIQCSVANALELPVGPYFHFASSMHLYSQHWDRVAELHEPDGTEDRTPVYGVGRPGMSWPAVQHNAAAILYGRPLAAPTRSEQWYIDKLAKYEPAYEEVEAGAVAATDIAEVTA